MLLDHAYRISHVISRIRLVFVMAHVMSCKGVAANIGYPFPILGFECFPDILFAIKETVSFCLVTNPLGWNELGCTFLAPFPMKFEPCQRNGFEFAIPLTRLA